MSSPARAPLPANQDRNPISLGKVSTALGIVVILLSGAFWLFSANATAQRADQNASSALQKLENKADKDDLKEMKQDIKEIRDFLLNGKDRR